MNVLADLAQVKHFLLDVDGVLTNGEILLLDSGEMARTMHVKDGYAMQLAIKQGYDISVISGGTSQAVEHRLRKLGIVNIFMGVENKLAVVEDIMARSGLLQNAFLFIGDDVPDTLAMLAVGVACCPYDAVPEIKKISKYISPVKGGQGCVRDVIEKVLKINNHWILDTHVKSV